MAATRRLYLLRHARAASARPGQSDHDRELDRQGESDALALGRLMAGRGLTFAQVVSSGAARTRGTWACLAAAGIAAPIVYDDSLYHGGEEAYGDAARAAPAGALLIGHNPTIADFARRLTGEGDRLAVEALSRGLATCSLAVLRVDDAMTPGGAFLEELLAPPFAAR